MKKIKNNTESARAWCGQEILPAAYYQIQSEEESRWMNDSFLLIDIAAGLAIVNNGESDILDVNSAITFLKDGSPKEVIVQSLPASPPFASNQLGDKGIFMRVHGVQAELSEGSNTIDFVVPYTWAKINGVELIGGEALDAASFYILDSTVGTYTSVPNYQLNRFGFDVNMRSDYYKNESSYDANLRVGMQIRIVYTSHSAKKVGVNYLLHEVK